MLWARNLGKWLAIRIIPPLYNSYLWIVYYTSKKVHSDLQIIFDVVDRGESVIGTVWHQDAILGPFIGRGRDVVTMVSHSDLGNVLSEIMRRCHFIPVRGGSGDGGKEALADIIDYMNSHPGSICGMAVDGSRGPARKVQIGALLLSRETGAVIYPVRLYAKWKVFAPTWDKTLLPFPFNRLVFLVGEAIRVPGDADREELEGLRLELEDQLQELAERSEKFFREETK